MLTSGAEIREVEAASQRLLQLCKEIEAGGAAPVAAKSEGKGDSKGEAKAAAKQAAPSKDSTDFALEVDRTRSLLQAIAVCKRAGVSASGGSGQASADAAALNKLCGLGGEQGQLLDEALRKFAGTLWEYAVFPQENKVKAKAKGGKGGKGGGKAAAKRKQEFSIDQLEAELQPGDSGFLNENATLLRQALAVMRSRNTEAFEAFLEAHSYLTGQLAQAGAIDVTEHLQDWARTSSQLVFVCLTCTQPAAQEPSRTGVGAGMCFGCADRCHKALSHRVQCIGAKRSFRCDCGKSSKYQCVCLRSTGAAASAAGAADSASASSAFTFSFSSAASKRPAAAAAVAAECDARTTAAAGAGGGAAGAGAGSGSGAESKSAVATTNSYNHNFDIPPSWCYEDCLFGNSSSVDESRVLDVKQATAVSASNPDGFLAMQEKFSAASVVQCTQCQDWFHPRCTFDEADEIKEVLGDASAFLCNNCDAAAGDEGEEQGDEDEKEADEDGDDAIAEEDEDAEGSGEEQ